MWYTTAHKAILLTVDLIPFPFKVEQTRSIKSSQEANGFETRYSLSKGAFKEKMIPTLIRISTKKHEQNRQ
jgi:hypothetical protein